MDLSEGILTVRILEGKFTRDTEMFGQMSPYCTLVFQGKKLKTKVIYNGGKTPKFNEEFQLEVNSPSEELTIRVWDQDVTTSDPIGWTKIQVSSLMINMGVHEWFNITYDQKNSGQLLLESKFEPKGGNQYEMMKEKLEEQTRKAEAEAAQAKAYAAQLEGQLGEMQAKLDEQKAHTQALEGQGEKLAEAEAKRQALEAQLAAMAQQLEETKKAVHSTNGQGYPSLPS
jgi:Ca2+-dependent lipid-binding protein